MRRKLWLVVAAAAFMLVTVGASGSLASRFSSSTCCSNRSRSLIAQPYNAYPARSGRNTNRSPLQTSSIEIAATGPRPAS